MASQVAVGNENEIALRVYGTRGGLAWSHRAVNELTWCELGGSRQILTRNGPGADGENRRMSRVPAGHPEGYLEGFANIYAEAAEAIVAARDGQGVPAGRHLPDRRRRRRGPRPSSRPR